LVLKNGKVAAAGPLHATVTSEVLGNAFGIDLRVEESYGRYTARSGQRTPGTGRSLG